MFSSTKKIILFLLIITAVAIGWRWQKQELQPTESIIIPLSPFNSPTLRPKTSKKLSVPYINEAPSGNWSGPWKNACEEASIAMVEFYYQGKTSVSIADAEAFMSMLFAKEDAKYGNNFNSDGTQMKYMIDNFTSYHAEIIRDPTIEQIKNELDNARPVISLHYGFDLHNPNIPFLRGGTYYHAMVIIGYDDTAQEFIVNDDGDTKTGIGHRYAYAVFINSLHEYNYVTKKADGESTVIFTSTP